MKCIFFDIQHNLILFKALYIMFSLYPSRFIGKIIECSEDDIDDTSKSGDINDIIQIACEAGDIRRVICTITEHKEDICPKMITDAFATSCGNGHLELAQQLLITYSGIVDISGDNDEAFRFACANGHLPIAEWLWDISGENINVDIYNNEAFRWACSNGHLDVAKWLLFIDSMIDISCCENYALNCARVNGHNIVVDWLKNAIAIRKKEKRKRIMMSI
jgi:ankyrin repeat protein